MDESSDQQTTTKCMSHDQFVDFCSEQKVEMEKHKWIESEKAGCDLGNCAIMDWIRKYAKQFREEYTTAHK